MCLVELLLRHHAVAQEILHAAEIRLGQGNVHGLGVHVSLGRGHRGFPGAQPGRGLFGAVPCLAQGALRRQQRSAGAHRVVARAVLCQPHLQFGVPQARPRHLYRGFRLGHPRREVIGVKLCQQLAAFHLLVLGSVNGHHRAADARADGHNVADHICVVGGFVRLVVLPQLHSVGRTDADQEDAERRAQDALAQPHGAAASQRGCVGGFLGPALPGRGAGSGRVARLAAVTFFGHGVLTP